MFVRGVHHIGLNSSDAARLSNFYRDMFGFKPVMDFQEWRDWPALDRFVGGAATAARFTLLRAANCYIEIFQYTSPAADSVRPLAVWDRGYTHVCLAVENICQVHADLLSRGMEFIGDDVSDFDGLRAIYGRDPDGNLIELMEAPSGHIFDYDALEMFAPRAEPLSSDAQVVGGGAPCSGVSDTDADY